MKRWADATAEERAAWGERAPRCDGHVDGSPTPRARCIGPTVWWHPRVDLAFCELHVPVEFVTHITRLWEEDAGVIAAAVGAEIRAQRRREIAARLGPKVVVFARPLPDGVFRRR